MDDKTKKKNDNTPKAPRKITERYLYNAGLHYLNRYPSSTKHFQTIMMRKIHKSCKHHEDQDLEECQNLLDQATDKFIEMGLLNDDQYAHGMVLSYRKRGVSQKAIVAKLSQKRVPQDLIIETIKTIDESLKEFQDYPPELNAALTHARKKRLGPFSLDLQNDPDHIRKAMGSMARAGFSYDVTKQVMDMDEPPESHIRY